MKRLLYVLAVLVIVSFVSATNLPNRLVAIDNVVFSAFDSDSTLTAWYETRPVAGVFVDGAAGILITISADSIGTGASRADKGDFSLTWLFSDATSDTAIVMYPLADSLLVTSAVVYAYETAAGAVPTVSFAIDCPGTRFTGYFYLRMKGQGATVIGNMDIYARTLN